MRCLFTQIYIEVYHVFFFFSIYTLADLTYTMSHPVRSHWMGFDEDFCLPFTPINGTTSRWGL